MDLTIMKNNSLKFRIRRLASAAIALTALMVVAACSVSYKFNMASIDYSKVKTIRIADFPNRSTYIWGPMAPMFNNQLKDAFANHTKLQQVKRGGDLVIEGQITQYSQRNKSVSSEGSEDFEKQFTATSTYETTKSLNAVQEELVTQMVKDLTDQIFNATVANW